MTAVYYGFRYYRGKSKYPFKAYELVVHGASENVIKHKADILVAVLSKIFTGNNLKMDITGPLKVNEMLLQSVGVEFVRWNDIIKKQSLKSFPFDYKQSHLWEITSDTLNHITLKHMEARFGIKKATRGKHYYFASKCNKKKANRTGLINIIKASSIAEASYIYYTTQGEQIYGELTDVSWLCDVY